MTISLLRSNGPECPRCGCPTTLREAGSFGGRPWSIFECDFCGNAIEIGRSPIRGPVVNNVIYKTVRCVCPACGAKNPPVVNTNGKVRWHKCVKCAQTFKSVEAE
jgi:hypothetical protein